MKDVFDHITGRSDRTLFEQEEFVHPRERQFKRSIWQEQQEEERQERARRKARKLRQLERDNF